MQRLLSFLWGLRDCGAAKILLSNLYTVHLGLTGKNCETDVNECLQNPFPCFKGNCVNKWSTYECNCLSGYFGANCNNFLVQVIFCKNNTRSFNQPKIKQMILL